MDLCSLVNFSDYKYFAKDYVILTGIIFLICICPCGLTAEENVIEKPTCAVLPFEALYGLEKYQAEFVTGSFIEVIAISKRLKLVDRVAIDNILDAHTLEKLPMKERALKLGRLLKVNKTIAGTVESEKGIYVVHTILMDIETGEIEGEITSYSDNDFNQMLSKIPDENARKLMMKLELSPQYKKKGNRRSCRSNKKNPGSMGKAPGKRIYGRV